MSSREYLNSRLVSKLPVKEGRQQLILTGSNIQDWFMIDLATGAKSLSDAVQIFAQREGYEVVVQLDKRLQPRFLRPEMNDLFDRVVKRVSVDPKGEISQRAKTFVPRSNSESPKTTNSSSQAQEAAENATNAAVNAEQNMLDQMYRLLNSECKSMVLFLHPEELLQNGTSGSEIEKLRSIIRWCTIPTGNPDNCSVLVVNPSLLQAFKECADSLVLRDARTSEVTIGPPDSDELRVFLLRVAARYGLRGSPNHLAKQFAAPSQTLYNFAQRIRGLMRDRPDCQSLDDLFVDRDGLISIGKLKEQLHQMVGLDELKRHIDSLEAFAKVRSEQRRWGQSYLEDKSFHMFFLGNPGTGKTEAAKLVGEIFRAIGLCSNDDRDSTIVISRPDVISAYNVGDTEAKMSAVIESALGRVLFIDEIHQFVEDEQGKSALRVLMQAMEKYRNQLIVIMAGYEERLPDIYQVDPGFESRVSKILRFRDYTVAELFKMFEAKCSADKLTLTQEATQKVIAYIDSFCKRGGIGNGRGIRNLYERVQTSHVLVSGGDLDKPVTAEMIPDGLVFREEEARRILADIDREFQGLLEVKEHFQNLFLRQKGNHRKGSASNTDPEHCRFVGNPGTGKTSVARKMGLLCHSLGLISESNKLVEVNPGRDFLSSKTGEYAQLVREQFERAEGGVLFIDEAYQLAETDQGKQVLNQIVTIITERGFANVLVIMAGYPDKMVDLLQVNEGLERRFPHLVRFQDFSADSLVQIFSKTMLDDGHSIADKEQESFYTRLRVLLELKCRRTNAGGVKVFYKRVKQNQERRVFSSESTAEINDREFLTVDLDGADKVPLIAAIFDDLNRSLFEFGSFIGFLNELIEDIEFDRQRSSRSSRMSSSLRFAYNSLLIGNSGTGKSSAAKYLAMLLANFDITSSDEVRSVAAVNLKASYTGQTKDRVKREFDNSHGKILLIQNVAALCDQLDVFSSEALEAIESCIASKTYEDVVVLLELLPHQLDILQSDRNWSSYFPRQAYFPDYSSHESFQILHGLLIRDGFRLADELEIHEELLMHLKELVSLPSFSNGHTLRNEANRLQRMLKKRSRESRDFDLITLEDVRRLRTERKS